MSCLCITAVDKDEITIEKKNGIKFYMIMFIALTDVFIQIFEWGHNC